MSYYLLGRNYLVINEFDDNRRFQMQTYAFFCVVDLKQVKSFFIRLHLSGMAKDIVLRENIDWSIKRRAKQ